MKKEVRSQMKNINKSMVHEKANKRKTHNFHSKTNITASSDNERDDSFENHIVPTQPLKFSKNIAGRIREKVKEGDRYREIGVEGLIFENSLLKKALKKAKNSNKNLKNKLKRKTELDTINQTKISELVNKLEKEIRYREDSQQRQSEILADLADMKNLLNNEREVALEKKKNGKMLKASIYQKFKNLGQKSMV